MENSMQKEENQKSRNRHEKRVKNINSIKGWEMLESTSRRT